ncbi:UNVERIFIED_CONTAM: hypothetical protein PYX00_011103 [Menopon gallinae]|uniref:Aminotransferase class V domain-containing protein n=1 Tax=Menopon gallinae TaxID=328185 RepID=A0AAW2H5Y4_9NEOP
MPYLTYEFGNPHSNSHNYGYKALEAVERARESIANLIKANPKEIYFTSGATEANNLALKGILEYYSKTGKNHLIVTKIEHKCVLSVAHYLKSKGFDVTFLPVENNGLINLSQLESAIKPTTALVSIIGVHNEIGVIQPLKEIGKLCREKGVLFHTDGAQALGKININVDDFNIDLMRKPKVRISPQMHGGGQEKGIRSGTLSPFLCVGMGKACDILAQEMEEDNKRIKELSSYLWNRLNSALPKIYLNGDVNQRVPHNLNISFAGVEGESLILAVNEVIAVSTGSACSSASLEGSYVLKALGIDEDLAHTSIRMGIGKTTTHEDVEKAANTIISSVEKLRKMSPIWEMIEQGIDLKTVKWHEH